MTGKKFDPAYHAAQNLVAARIIVEESRRSTRYDGLPLQWARLVLASDRERLGQELRRIA